MIIIIIIIIIIIFIIIIIAKQKNTVPCNTKHPANTKPSFKLQL